MSNSTCSRLQLNWRGDELTCANYPIKRPFHHLVVLSQSMKDKTSDNCWRAEWRICMGWFANSWRLIQSIRKLLSRSMNESMNRVAWCADASHPEGLSVPSREEESRNHAVIWFNQCTPVWKTSYVNTSIHTSWMRKRKKTYAFCDSMEMMGVSLSRRDAKLATEAMTEALRQLPDPFTVNGRPDLSTQIYAFGELMRKWVV